MRFGGGGGSEFVQFHSFGKLVKVGLTVGSAVLHYIL